MIMYYGVFQLVKVVKIGETKKKDPMVYFTAASYRDKDTSDFKLFKAFGKNAERFIKNLEKKGDGYKSRRMMIEGYVETYTDNKEVVCSASIKKDKFPAKYGEIIKDFKVEAKATVKMERDSYVINRFQFLDKKLNGEATILDADAEDEGTTFVDDDEVDTTDNYMDTIENLSSKKNKSSSLASSVLEGEEKLRSFKDLI